MKKQLFFVISIILITFLVGCNESILREDLIIDGDLISQNVYQGDEDFKELTLKNLFFKIKSKESCGKVYFIESSEKKIEIYSNSSMENQLKISTSTNKFTIEGNNKYSYCVDNFELYFYGYQWNNLSISCFDVDVEENCLEESAKFNFSGATDAKANLTNVKLLDINLSGASTFEADNVDLEDLNINASGASNVSFHSGSIKNAEMNFSGASELDISGVGEYLTIHCSGNSSINAEGFISSYVTLELSGTSDAIIYCTKTINYSLSGISSLRIKGDCEVGNVSISGNSVVTRIK